ncbi:zinc ribbon domain-containing protein [Paralcaligenes sp. KSB-10]|uniref:FmdB family zinc ribbon protein n=1 Tax=Paralcaligenes sp. KSB-10 TaxID=2901142 RepID=UPI001E57334A|nr:FmdB family zinc ribbon protein [Paralcaligenes sp. KSB-10]UHL63757.1 zinc ribbon domain-containing protein [Paralcaligenes sp. KSB-10]
MPIYAYKCSACGHEQDVLQKMSDPLLKVCPECGQSTYSKQVTAAGFQLKGSGWYVTDFRGNGAKPAADGKPASAAGAAKAADGAAAAAPASSSESKAAPAAAPASSSPPSTPAASST